MLPCSGETQLVGAAAAALLALAALLRGGARAVRAARGIATPPTGGGPMTLTSKRRPEHLDGVGLLDLLVLVVVRQRRRGNASVLSQSLSSTRSRQVSALAHCSVASNALWNGISVLSPSISYSPSARSMRLVAFSRSVSQTISLATIGSYIGVTSPTGPTPESTRTPGPARLLVVADLARGGREVPRRVLGVDAALDRVAAQLDVLLLDGQRLAGGGEDALAHDVDAGHHLGHAVLDLHARVHLQEEVLPVLEQALDRAGADVVDGARRVDADLADRLAHRLVDGRGRRLLDQLLVAALDRAVALAEVDDVAVAVGEDLDLDVARVGQVALEVDGAVGEELLALARGALEGVLELVLGQRDAEALAAAAAGRLDGDRVADLVLGDTAARLRASRPPRSCRGRSGRRRPASARAPWSWSPSRRSRRRAGR